MEHPDGNGSTRNCGEEVRIARMGQGPPVTVARSGATGSAALIDSPQGRQVDYSLISQSIATPQKRPKCRSLGRLRLDLCPIAGAGPIGDAVQLLG